MDQQRPDNGSQSPEQAQEALQDDPSRKSESQGSWGQGSATALDTLRRRNYRGRHGDPGERPSSE